VAEDRPFKRDLECAGQAGGPWLLTWEEREVGEQEEEEEED
jgi:hypothetical protein